MPRPVRRAPLARLETPPAHPPQIEAGRRLRAARKALGLTQREIAEVGGVTPHGVSQWESGAKRINPFAMVRIKARWGISLDFVFAGDISGLPHGLASAVSKDAFRTIK